MKNRLSKITSPKVTIPTAILIALGIGVDVHVNHPNPLVSARPIRMTRTVRTKPLKLVKPKPKPKTRIVTKKPQPKKLKIIHRNLPNPYISNQILPMSAHHDEDDDFDSDSAESAMVFNDKTGQITYGHNVHEHQKVASTGKLMTLFLAQRKANQTKGWKQKVTIPKSVADMSNDDADGVGSQMKLKAGHQYSVEELYQSAIIESSDSASIALGQWVSGDNAKFVNLMNQQMRAWHLHGKFISASGLENDSIEPFGFKVSGGKTDGNQLSAMDLAVIAQHLLHDFPKVTQWSSEAVANVHGTQITNVNDNLKGKGHYVPGIDGLKTGYTPSAGYCYVGSKKEGDHHKIVVLLKDQQEFADGQSLLNNQD